MSVSAENATLVHMRKTNGTLGAALIAAMLTTGLAAPAVARTAPIAATVKPDAETHDSKTDLVGLLRIEDNAEAVAEGEKLGSAAAAAAHAAVTGWPAVRATLAENGAAPIELTTADRAFGTLARDTTAGARLRRDANEVTGALAALFTHAGDPVPADVHRLDYLGRSVSIDVRTGDWNRALRDDRELQTRWKTLGPHIALRAHGAATAAAFDTAVHGLTTAIEARRVDAALAAAGDIGDGVDALEKLYA